MASKTDIANEALQLVGAKSIMDINDDSLKGAREVLKVFETSVRQLARRAKWQCLRNRQSLAQLSTTPAFGYSYQYQLPTNYIRMISFNQEDVWDNRKYLYEIEGKKILTNEETATIVYVEYVEDTNQYEPLFVECLAYAIAHRIAVPMRQDEALAQSLLQTLEQIKLPEARRIDASDKKRTQWNPLEESRIIQSRRFNQF